MIGYKNGKVKVPKQHMTKTVKTVRHDGGPADFGNKAFNNMLKKYDITDEPTSGASTGNAKAERRIGVGKTDSLTIMAWCHGPADGGHTPLDTPSPPET